ncbi:MAG: hypothetical protein HC897_11210 [Thermoanaerobaculia bacterium]|nr:hypothetical protein [Thermoanaerobaculia bacterium]
MIRKRAHLELPVEQVRGVFVDTDRWPAWMPGVSGVRTLRTSSGYRLLEVRQTHYGYTFVQTLECHELGSILRHRQHEGWFAKFEAEWAFEPDAAGRGTVLTAAVDFSMGRLALLSPRPLVEIWMGNHTEKTIAEARRRAERLGGHGPC